MGRLNEQGCRGQSSGGHIIHSEGTDVFYSASQSIAQERQKVGWSHINPTIVHLLTKDTESEKETTLFGSLFQERVAKRL